VGTSPRGRRRPRGSRRCPLGRARFGHGPRGLARRRGRRPSRLAWRPEPPWRRVEPPTSCPARVATSGSEGAVVADGSGSGADGANVRAGGALGLGLALALTVGCGAMGSGRRDRSTAAPVPAPTTNASAARPAAVLAVTTPRGSFVAAPAPAARGAPPAAPPAAALAVPAAATPTAPAPTDSNTREKSLSARAASWGRCSRSAASARAARPPRGSSGSFALTASLRAFECASRTRRAPGGSASRPC
jgi:hypothetical protein